MTTSRRTDSSQTYEERVEAIERGDLIPPDCPDCGHNGRVEPRSTGGPGWECFGCGCLFTPEEPTS